MRALIDTHVFLRWVEGDRALSRKARALIADEANECLISVASAWELAIKSGLGKIRLALPVRRYIAEHVASNGFRVIDIELAHAARVETLEPHHGDPFDRLLIAQAIEERIPIVTADAVFEKYGVERIW